MSTSIGQDNVRQEPAAQQSILSSGPYATHSLNRNGINFDEFSLLDPVSTEEASKCNINNNKGAGELSSSSSSKPPVNAISKAHLIKQLAETFKDMNENSEYDDVVKELENELRSFELPNNNNKNDEPSADRAEIAGKDGQDISTAQKGQTNGIDFR